MLPGGRQVVWLLVGVLSRMSERAGEVGEGGELGRFGSDAAAIFGVALDGPIAESQLECSIGRRAGAKTLVSETIDDSGVAGNDRIHFVVEALANGASGGIKVAHQRDKRVVAGCYGSRPASVELTAEGEVIKFRSGDKLLSCFFWGATGEDLLDHGVIG